jgi:hypothetical protein
LERAQVRLGGIKSDRATSLVDGRGGQGAARLFLRDGGDGREGRGVQGEGDDEGKLWDKTTLAETTRREGALNK